MTNRRNEAQALDAELAGKSKPTSSEDWEEKVAIAKEARALGAKLQKSSGAASSVHNTFPHK